MSAYFEYRRKPLDVELPEDYFALEALCFGPIYRMAPSNREAFHRMFREDCDVFSCLVAGNLVGLAFLEDVNEHLSYLRVICVHPGFRQRGIAVALLNCVRDHMVKTGKHLMAFVSEETALGRACVRAGFESTKDKLSEGASTKLGRYSSRLIGSNPGVRLPAYYVRPDGTLVDGQFYVMRPLHK